MGSQGTKGQLLESSLIFGGPSGESNELHVACILSCDTVIVSAADCCSFPNSSQNESGNNFLWGQSLITLLLSSIYKAEERVSSPHPMLPLVSELALKSFQRQCDGVVKKQPPDNLSWKL